LKDEFDSVLVHVFEKLSLGGSVTPLNFVKRNRSVLLRFVDVPDLNHAIECIDKGVHPEPSTFRRVLGSCKIAALLFKEQGLKIEYVLFLGDIQKRLVDLAHNDYEIIEVNSFKKLFIKQAQLLNRNGAVDWDKGVGKISFFGSDTQVPLLSHNDQWELRLMADLKGNAVASKLLEPLPWETLILDAVGPGKLRENCRIPAELLTDFMNVRDAIYRVMGRQPLTIKEMKRILNPHKKAFCELDRSVVLELTFLDEEVETILTGKLHQKVLDAFPHALQQKTISEVCFELEKMKASNLCVACGADLESEVSGVCGLLRRLEEGTGPKLVDIYNYSAFYKHIVKALEYFVSFYVRPSGVRCFGREAIAFKFTDALDRITNGEPIGLPELRDFRRFEWLLKDDERNLVNEWINNATRLSVHDMLKLENGFSGKGGGGGGGSAGAMAASSSFNPGKEIVPLDVLNAAVSTSKGKKATVEKPSGAAPSLLKFFVPA
jgi:hypothetical protein